MEKKKGTQIIGATINSTGSLVMRAEKIGTDTVLSQIVHMAAEAQSSRASIQKLADIVAAYLLNRGFIKNILPQSCIFQAILSIIIMTSCSTDLTSSSLF